MSENKATIFMEKTGAGIWHISKHPTYDEDQHHCLSLCGHLVKWSDILGHRTVIEIPKSGVCSECEERFKQIYDPFQWPPDQRAYAEKEDLPLYAIILDRREFGDGMEQVCGPATPEKEAIVRRAIDDVLAENLRPKGGQRS